MSSVPASSTTTLPPRQQRGMRRQLESDSRKTLNTVWHELNKTQPDREFLKWSGETLCALARRVSEQGTDPAAHGAALGLKACGLSLGVLAAVMAYQALLRDFRPAFSDLDRTRSQSWMEAAEMVREAHHRLQTWINSTVRLAEQPSDDSEADDA